MSIDEITTDHTVDEPPILYFENLERERECVLNLPSADLVDAVDQLALTTGAEEVSTKARRGYRYEPASSPPGALPDRRRRPRGWRRSGEAGRDRVRQQRPGEATTVTVGKDR